MVAEVIINSTVKNLNKTFDYNVPAELAGTIKLGDRVLLPFGNAKTLEEGFVVGLKDTSEYKVKDIAGIQEGFKISKENIELARWMAKRYFCNISDAIKMMLPPGTSTKVIENRVKEKSLNFVYLKKEIDEIELAIETKVIKSDKHIRVLRFLEQNDGVLTTDLEMFCDVSRAIIHTLEKNGYIEIVEKQVERNPFLHKVVKKDSNLVFTQEQQHAYKKIADTIEKRKFEEFLIYGVTGSGKTEIYLQLIQKVISQNQSAIMLVPEISLTPQMLDRFIARFGQEQIAVLHSKLSVGERYDQWQRIKKNEAKIIIGARSAIFAPVENLGLIIIDEEHDDSYKSEMTPRYHAREVARKMATDKQIPLVLGSATPDMTTFYRAKQNEIKLLTLTKRANNSNLPEVEIIDLREELASGNKTMLSRRLYDEISKNLENKHQTILFLNRRGFSTFVMCRDCGYTVKCKNCNITLTYHMKENKLKCHYCGYEQPNVTVCPECGSDKIKYFGTGTQKLEAQIQKIFPNASMIRMDVDTVSKKNSHEEILNKFRDENIDILIGTQMVVKGHHFPNVTLVGVIAADGSLNIDDYRASERTFQILTQVAGRAGRENLPGKVIIQTYNPDHFSIECASKQNYNEFYKIEENLRKQLKYPPFCDIIVIGISGEKEEKVKNISEFLGTKLNAKIKEFNADLMLYSPRPAPIDKIKNKYRWRIILKGDFDDIANEVIKEVLEEAYTKGSKTRIVVDVNPSSMM